MMMKVVLLEDIICIYTYIQGYNSEGHVGPVTASFSDSIDITTITMPTTTATAIFPSILVKESTTIYYYLC